jgi:polyisoprenoid-binding protein YceI
MKWIKSRLRCAHRMALCILLFLVFVPRGRAQAPVFAIIPVQSWIKFHVKSSVTIAGKFDKWDGSLTFRSQDETTGVLEKTSL